MSNYHREKGDNLYSKDKHLKYKWQWSRIASGRTTEEIKKWTHFQSSAAQVGEWELDATQWGAEDITYEANVNYNGRSVCSKENFKTRIEAQIGAEALLKGWIEKQYQLING